MHDLICDCPYRYGNGECSLELFPAGEHRHYPVHCPKHQQFRSLKTFK
jgi:hypothetical protein